MSPRQFHFSEACLPLFPDDEAPSQPLPSGKLPSYIKDHRIRLRERFMRDGGHAMPDYELLELVLFAALPRKDVKPLARHLLDRFGSFSGVISARPETLQTIHEVGPTVIAHLKVVEAAAQRLMSSKIRGRDVLSSWDAVVSYCRTAFAHRETEQFCILFLDRKNVLIAHEDQAEGTIDHVPVYPREVVKRALELNASSLILVHNHPSGDPTPSNADIDMTRRICEVCDVLGISVHDHLIVGKESEVSFRAMGYL